MNADAVLGDLAPGATATMTVTVTSPLFSLRRYPGSAANAALNMPGDTDDSNNTVAATTRVLPSGGNGEGVAKLKGEVNTPSGIGGWGQSYPANGPPAMPSTSRRGKRSRGGISAAITQP